VQQAVDEIKLFMDGRYMSASEADWRIRAFSMHRESPAVYRLAVHLPNEQRVTFSEDRRPDPAAHSETTLTAFFRYNSANPTCSVLYPDFPSSFVYHKGQRCWTARRRAGRNGRTTIGRMYFVPPAAGERYYLRLLLTQVAGATSFEHLRTVDGEVLPTFQAAAQRRGLLASDDEWDRCLQEASGMQMPAQLRELFASVLLFASPADPWALWLRHQEAMTEDLLQRERVAMRNPHLPLSPPVIDEALHQVQDHLARHGKSLADFPSMRVPPPRAVLPGALPPLVQEHLRYDREALAGRVQQQLPMLNADQRVLYDTFMAAADGGLSGMEQAGRRSNLFFVDAPGGCGKTFTFNLLLASLRSTGCIALAVASSGIAALLLEGGATAHSRFKIPININAESTCNVPVQSPLAQLLQRAAAIIWDEAPMMHRHCLEALDRTLRDIMAATNPALEHVPFGGKCILLGGDFRQVLPVVPKGGRAAIVNASLKVGWGGLTVRVCDMPWETSLGVLPWCIQFVFAVLGMQPKQNDE
jgi:hypothetical protein